MQFPVVVNVSKKVGYGCRDNEFFFLLVRFIFLQSVKYHPSQIREEPNILVFYSPLLYFLIMINCAFSFLFCLIRR